LKKLVLNLGEEDLIWLRRIITDRDRDEALEFIRKVLEPEVKEAERPSGLQRTFDAGGPPGQIGGPM
jgi:hypothetical protein